ncbi:phage tail tape measure protein [Pseudomonas huaxiensis]|uniref:phage tail tape measure protein n=1 Tax=Pseudomonas huaxiensis TaxID=2213017 RepID=UPI000DA680F0|nr:phage tail tape measure protein [Pseudomonas huaxiensis]
MASNLALSLVIGGAVASSFGSALKTAENGISKLEQKGNKAKVLKSTIGETIKLREEWKKAHDTGSASAAGLLRRLDANLDALRKQGVQVGRLEKEYQRLGRTAKAVDLQVKGRQQLDKGKEGAKSTVGKATAAVAAVTIPTMISAGYQATIRDIAIKAGVANQPEEQAMAKQIIQVSQDTGMSRDGVADLVNQLVGAGMELDKALSYSTVAAKFSVGQGASGVDVASMIQALEQNAKISDPKVMEKTLEGIALQGQAGSFEASDMARWFPVLLAGMEKTGSTGPEAVAQLGAMLQVQMKTAGSSDEAANNLKNWIEKIGAGDVVKAYKDAGIDYQASLNTGIQKGMSVLESSMALAQKYVQTTDPAKAKKMADAQAKIDKEVDPKKAIKALEALEQSLKTGDIFADMQVKAALTAYGQNRGLYEQLKKDAQDATGILDKNLQERRETSAQMWTEAKNDINEAMRSIGDAIRPATDAAAKGISWVAKGLVSLSDGAQVAVMGIGAIVAGYLALKSIISGYRITKGLADIGRGNVLERLAERASAAGDAAGSRSRGPGTSRKPGLLDRLRGAGNDGAGESLPKVGDTQKVFVVNADAFGRGTGSGGDGAPDRRRRPRRRPGRPRPPQRPGRPKGVPKVTKVPDVPKVPKVPVAPTSAVGDMFKSARNFTKAGKRLPGMNVIDLGVGAVDLAMNAHTQDEKAEGFGGLLGGAAGSAAGAAAGAALGTLILPVIGTAIGGIAGSIIGGMAGEEGGSWLGKALFGEKKEEAVAQAELPPAATTVTKPVATVSYDPRDPNSQDPFLLPALTANRVGFPGAALVKPQVPIAQPPVAIPPAVAQPLAPQVSYDPRDPNSKDPFLLPALTENRVRFPGAELVKPQSQSAAMGDVVRDLATAPAAVPSVPELAKAAAVKPEAPKVEQSFTFAPNIPVNVHGDVKDPAQMAQEIWPHIQRQMEDFARQQQVRQLSDEPHV